MLQKTAFLSIAIVCSYAATAQQPVQSVKVNPQPQAAPPVFTYKKINTELEYAFIINKPTSPKPEEGGQISVNMMSVCNNRMIYNTMVAFKGKPAVYSVTKPAFKGDLIEAIMLMTPGDSIVCQVDAGIVFKGSKTKLPDFIKAGDKMQYYIKLVSVKSKADAQKEQQAAFQKQMNEQMAKQKVEAAKLIAKDDKTLKAFFTKKSITPLKTASGLYYTIKEEGTGENALPGDTVVMNYTGTLLDGTKFDSNEDTAFHHVTPFKFVLGRGAVIKGWDEGVALLKTGSKATLYIPSGMAYGPQARPGSGANPKGIPANSILVFDVQLLSATHPAPPPPPAPKADTLVAPVPVKDSTVAPVIEEPAKKE